MGIRILSLSMLALLLCGPLWGRKENLALREVSIDLPGAPAAIISADVDGDGFSDLAIVIAYTEWSQIVTEESVEMDQVEGLVEMMTIVPSLADRRELLLFRGLARGGFEPFGAPLELDLSILSVMQGPAGMPIVALTDDGISRLRIVSGEEGDTLHFEPVFEGRSVLSYTGALLPQLDLFFSLGLDTETQLDLVFPARDGFDVFVGDLRKAPSHSRVLLPDPDPDTPARQSRHYPLPIVADIDGDGLGDLLLRPSGDSWDRFWVARNRGNGHFSEFVEIEVELPEDSLNAVYFGDLDGDGRAEWVLEEDLSDPDAGWRKEMKEAKVPSFRYRIYSADSDLSLIGEPRVLFETQGYAFEGGDGDFAMPFGLQDLDGDGRQDLVSVTLDFSLWQAVRILATKTLSIELDFHVWCQKPDGSFKGVRGLDLSGKFKLRLDDLRIGQLSQFAGDFDGDGRRDFLQMGRGKKVTMHLGREGCAYPPTPDLELKLREEPKNLALVQVRDLDGDDLSDFLVVQPQSRSTGVESAPVRLDLYLSREEP